MDVIVWVFIAFAHIFYVHGIPFAKPIALDVVKQDLQILKEQFPSADQWPLRRVIKYDNNIEFIVDYDQQTGNDFIVVVGTLSVATFKRSPLGGHEIASLRLIRKFFVDKAGAYFDDLRHPDENLEGFYIVEYYPEFSPLRRQIDYKPVIEYVAEKQFEDELIDHIPRIRYESNLSKAPVIKTYIRTKSGHKIHVRYQKDFDIAVFEADFYCLVNNDARDLIKKTIHFKQLSYDFEKLLAPDLLKNGYTYAVRVASFPSRSANIPTGSLIITKDVLLKDVQDSASLTTKRTPDVVGVIKYDSNIVLTLTYPSADQKFSVALEGKFITSDGIPFRRLCIALPQNSANEISSDKSSEGTVFVSCPEEGKDSQILFQEDTDILEIVSEDSKITDVIQKLTNVEPYIEYISYQQLERTLEILSDVLSMLCLEGYPRRSYRLFVDVFLNYDCNAQVGYFEKLNLWSEAGQVASSLTDNVQGVSYNFNTKHFHREGSILSEFKIRQLHPVFKDKIPSALRYISYSGTTDIAFDVKSVEWDLHNLRTLLLKNILPQWGVVYVDDSVLFVAEKSKRTTDGVKKWAIVVKGSVPNPVSCTRRDCMDNDLVVYDGTKIVVKTGRNQEVDLNPVPTKVYWPETQKLPPLNGLFSVSDRVYYTKFATIRSDLKELSVALREMCVTLKRNGPGAKLILHIFYPQNNQPMIGYYGCALNYIFFTSNFKIIKLASMHGDEARPAGSYINSPPSVTPKEFHTTESWRNDRTKNLQSEYVLQELQYDPIGDVFHSKSTSLTDVYALRILPTSFKVTSQNSRPVRLQLGRGTRVEVY